MAKGTTGIMNALITVVVSLALLPVIQDFVAAAIVGSSAAETLILGLVSLFWVLATAFAVIKMVK